MVISFGKIFITIRSGILIPFLVLIPNILWMVLSTKGSDSITEEPILLTIIENIGRIATLILPLFYSINWQKKNSIPVLAIMGIALLIYYVAWGRFFLNGRTSDLLSKPLFGIPLPLALAPVLFFIFSSYILDSWWMFAASVIFGTAHIWISILTL